MKKLKVFVFALIMCFSAFISAKSFANVTSVLLSANANSVQVSGTEFIITTGVSLCTPEITGSFVLNYRKGEVFCGDVEYLLPVTITSQNPISINGVSYKGTILLEENDGKLCVVNYVDVEDYLAGVLACEMSPKWPLEALKAQAVLARTYLRTQGQKHGKYAICSTEHCQAYKGIPKLCESVTQAITETKDLLVCYDNKPAQVFFYADSGGVTASSKDVWNGVAIPYSVSKPDPDVISQKFTTWKFRCNMSLVQEKLLADGVNLGTIFSITPTERDESGRVKQLEVKGQNGTKTIPSSLFRSALGATNIKSTLFKFAKINSADDIAQQQKVTAPVPPVQKTNPIKKVVPQNKKFNSKMDELMWLSEQGAYTTRELCAMLVDFDNYDKYIKNGYEILKTGRKTPANTPDTTIAHDNTAEEVPVTVTEDKKLITNESATDNVFMIIGYGSGHGVGMPQNQCKYLAQAGWTYDQILAYYFPGTVLSKGDVK